jgi:hypothetical protein
VLPVHPQAASVAQLEGVLVALVLFCELTTTSTCCMFTHSDHSQRPVMRRGAVTKAISIETKIGLRDNMVADDDR